MYKKLLIIIGLLLFSRTLLSAKELTFSFSFDKPEITQNYIESTLETKTSTPGEPVIPFHTAKILLPYGEKISNVKVTYSDWKNLEKGIYIDFAKIPQPTNSNEITPTEKNEIIYSSDNPYPASKFKIKSTEILAGHSIAIINLFPIRYLPKSGIIQYSSEMELSVITKSDEKLSNYQSKMLCNSNSIIERLEQFVKNQEELNSYFSKEKSKSARNNLINPDDPHDYIIITGENFVSLFDDFVDWKIGFGLNPAVYTIQDINTEYIGTDNADKLRNFIIDAYTSWNSSDCPLEYVLLGGDDEIVPLRKLYVDAGGTIGYIPSDFYFSALDGNFDYNGNGIYGEYPADSVDFIPEIAIGRIPGDTEIDFSNALYKIMDYTENPKPALEKACMVGENLNWNPVTWGGDYKDDILTRIPENNYHFYTLYQRDGTYSEQAVVNMLNNGVGIMNNMGHANYWILMGMSPNQADQLINNEYGLMYSQGCLPAAFDEGTSNGNEAVAERLIIASGGPMAFIGNTRYGWYSPDSIEGPSQQFDRTFFDGLFAEDIKQLGNCNNYSKVALINQADNPWIRWCYYELILFGDPHTEIITLDGEFPYVVPANITMNDELGDGDGIVNPGEEIKMIIELENLPNWQPAYDVMARMRYDGDEITIIDSISEFGNMLPGELSTNISDPIIFHVSDDCGYNNLNYQLLITANTDSLYPFVQTYYGSINVSLVQTNWPKYLGCEVKCSPVVVDFDNDNENEVLFVDRAGKIYSIEADASISDGFPVELEEEAWSSIAVGDIDNDQQYEIVLTTRYNKIYAIDNDKSIIFEYETGGQMICTPTVADLDGDEELEIIAPCLDGKLYVIKIDGTDFLNFPYNLGSPIFADVAVGDINNDTVQDIVVGTLNGSIYAISSEGVILDGFPIETDSQIWSPPIIFDNNSRIAFSSYDYKIYIIDGSGDIKCIKDISSNIFSSMIAFTQERDDEFLLAYNTLSGELGIINENGIPLPGWPQEMGTGTKNSPVAVDINNDGEIEILSSTTNGNVFCYSLNGELLPESPITGNLTINSSLTIDDLDKDGDFELISGTNSGVAVWDYKNPKGSLTPWTMYRGNIQRTGNYSDNIAVTSIDSNFELKNKFILYQNYPNPFNPDLIGTTISFSATDLHRLARIKIYNIKGQLVKNFEFRPDIIGTNSELTKVVWDGKNDNGNQVSNGIYFYKLLTKNYTSPVRRLLLLR